MFRLMICLLALVAIPPSVLQAADRPNVLLIAADDLRCDLGCYGNSAVKTPNLDRLAARSLCFDRAYCQQAVCNPSRASLLTGLRPDTIDIWDLPTHFREHRPDVVTLPQLFKQSGYHAQCIGKIFHNWRQDAYQGDPESWSVPAVMHYDNHGNDKPMVDGPLPPELAGVPKINLRDVPDEAYFDGRIAKLASEALHELKDQPFFLAVGFWKPHSPFNAPKKYWDLYDGVDISPPDPADAPRGVPPLALHDSREILGAFSKRPGGRPTAEETLKLRRGYYAAISYLDAQIGKVLDALEREGLAERTIVVFWSDHGYHLGEQTLWAKTSNFELDARVPLTIAAPGKAQATAGKSTEALVELVDLYPTLADLCGLQGPGDLDGKSLRPLLEGTAAKVKQAALTQHTRPAYPSEEEPLEAMGYAMRTEQFRYVEWRSVQDGSIVAQELYDHERDPRETVNLANDRVNGADHEPLLERLSAQLKTLAPPRAIAIEIK